MIANRFHNLITRNIISEIDLKEALVKARESKTDVETILMTKYNVHKKDILESFSQFYRCSVIEYSDRIDVPLELLRGINLGVLKKNYWVPVSHTDNRAVFAVSGLHDMTVKEIKRMIKAPQYEFLIAMKDDILKFIQSIEGEGAFGIHADKHGEAGARDDDKSTSDTATTEEGFVVRFVNQVIVTAHEKGASRVFIEPNKSRGTIDVRYIGEGKFIEHRSEIPYAYHKAVINRFKIMAVINIAQSNLPQEGKIKFLYKGVPILLFLHILPTINGESAVIRIANPLRKMMLEDIGLHVASVNRLKGVLEKRYGMFLVVGPRASGKTTALHALVSHLNVHDLLICAAEFPVEISHQRVHQIEVRPSTEFDIGAATNTILSVEPDVVMVGELNSADIAAKLLGAVIKGRLVLSSIYGTTTTGAIEALIEMGLDTYSLANGLLGVLALNLVPSLCSFCKEQYHPDNVEFEYLVQEYGHETFNDLNIQYNDKLVLYRETGCDKCNNTGYSGKTAIFELLIASENTRKLILKKSAPDVIRQQAIKDGMQTLYQDGISKVFAGTIELNQLIRTLH
ncbi:GspE/PulE family protein [Candidatus Magnetobacterium casense]|uniref:Flp pilus assembly complex ATPase component TadA n=1 Tax=Candidatus Magnetobacterium casense TaxID=1455061 RepID=A0ABS6RY49_9BACT|nr:ATPase, T2SS/T4P/T4SS family [Candidatus Magnetobacterium casensis]MBV6340728.1 Flp pilus assembly complex ATPase component TadA [Candidatus Magnetobacterium casensis]